MATRAYSNTRAKNKRTGKIHSGLGIQRTSAGRRVPNPQTHDLAKEQRMRIADAKEKVAQAKANFERILDRYAHSPTLVWKDSLLSAAEQYGESRYDLECMKDKARFYSKELYQSTKNTEQAYYRKTRDYKRVKHM